MMAGIGSRDGRDAADRSAWLSALSIESEPVTATMRTYGREPIRRP
jgi:hypothetical protein